MTSIIAITNQKGGVGKTTTTVNLAASLVAKKKSVLLIDLDPQGNATMGAGVDKYALSLSVYDVLLNETPIEDALQFSIHGGFQVLPANQDLTAAEVNLLNEIGREFRLKQALTALKNEFDYILIDCPPALNILTVNALVASTEVIIPMQCEYYALEGLSALVQTIEQIKKVLNSPLVIGGIIRTMYDPRNSLTNDVSKQLVEYFGDKVFKSVIPRNVRLAEAPSYGMPVLHYDKRSRGAVAYQAMASELIRRQRK